MGACKNQKRQIWISMSMKDIKKEENSNFPRTAIVSTNILWILKHSYEFWTVNEIKNIFFFENYFSFTLKDRNRLKSFLHLLCRKEKHQLEEIRIIFCDRKEIREINNKFLKHNYDTDIISFPFSEKNKPIEAELYICIPRIKEQAKEWNCSFKEELHRVIFHGVLHLCGYNDKTPTEKLKMREKENHYLKEYFQKVPRGTTYLK